VVFANLGLLDFDRGRYADAESAFKRALGHRRSATPGASIPMWRPT